MIFLGIAYGVLGQHFKEGTKMVVVGVGLALAFGLLLWEEQTGFSIIGSLGPFVAILLVFLLAMSFFTGGSEIFENLPSGVGSIFPIMLFPPLHRLLQN